MQTGLQPRLKYLNFIAKLLLVTGIILPSGIAGVGNAAETEKPLRLGDRPSPLLRGRCGRPDKRLFGGVDMRGLRHRDSSWGN